MVKISKLNRLINLANKKKIFTMKNIKRSITVLMTSLFSSFIYTKLNGAVKLGSTIYDEGLGLTLNRYTNTDALIIAVGMGVIILTIYWAMEK